MALFLVSDEALFVTGATVVAEGGDGGQSNVPGFCGRKAVVGGADVEIRACDAAVSDADLVNLAKRCAEGGEGLEAPKGEAVPRLRAMQAEDTDALTLAVFGKMPVGMCAVGLPGGGDAAVLRFLGVCSAWRRRGIGGALEAHSVGLARRHGRSTLRTGTTLNSRNEVGVCFLAHAGWRPSSGVGICMGRNLDNLPPVAVPSEYTIRIYRPGDEAAFVRIKNAAFAGENGGGRDWTVSNFEKAYLAAPCFHPERVLFSVYNGEPVGTTTAWTVTHEGREVGLIHWVAVLPSHRQKGLGRALTVQALHKLSALGYREAVLNTNERLASAVRLYNRLGFRDYCRRAVYEKKVSHSKSQVSSEGGVR